MLPFVGIVCRPFVITPIHKIYVIYFFRNFFRIFRKFHTVAIAHRIRAPQIRYSLRSLYVIFIRGLWALWGEGTGPQKDLWDAPERFNELGHLVESETDVEQRKAYYREMLEIWDDEVPGTILYCPDAIWAVREGLTWSYESGRAINLRAEYLTVS